MTSSMPGYSPLPEEETHADYLARTHTRAARQRRLAAIEAGGQPSSQVSYPWRAALRTAIQTGVSSLLALLIVWDAIREPISVWLSELGLPDAVLAWTLGVVGIITATATLLSRLMAVPAVDAWLRRWMQPAAPSPSE